MKKIKLVSSIIFVGVLAATSISCDKSGQDPKPLTPKPGPNDVVNNFFKNELAELKQSFTLSATNGGTIFGKDGTRIRFTAGSFRTQNNQSVSGEVTVELIEVYKKADMLLADMPTRGRNAEGVVSTLISGGEFYVNVKQNGAQLKMDANSSYEIAAPVATTGLQDIMFPFTGVEECDNNGDCDIFWEQNRGEVVVRDLKGDGTATGGTQSAYFTFQSQFGWTNIDKWFSDPRPKTTIFADVPDGYNNTNCAVYISYEGEPTALAAFDVYNPTTGLFTEHYDQIPIGLKVHFIMVSVIGEQWHYAIKSATITNNHVETFTELQPVTETQLRTIINELP
jgi:hypothetical protein